MKNIQNTFSMKKLKVINTSEILDSGFLQGIMSENLFWSHTSLYLMIVSILKSYIQLENAFLQNYC